MKEYYLMSGRGYLSLRCGLMSSSRNDRKLFNKEDAIKIAKPLIESGMSIKVILDESIILQESKTYER
jgi:hypothetical protein